MQTLYADVLFIIDFSMDVISLWLTARLTKAKTGTFSLSVAACIGALVSTVCTAMNLASWLNFLLSAVSSLVMCVIAFGKMKPVHLIKRFTSLWIVGILIGGVMTLLTSMGKGSEYAPEHDPSSGGIILILPIGAVVSYVFVTVLTRLTSKRNVAVTVRMLGEKYEFHGIVDSGNLLTEPISGDPVIVVCGSYTDEQSGFSRFFLETETLANEELAKRFRMIPAKSVFGEGILPAIRPDEVLVDGLSVRAFVALSKNTNKDREDVGIIVPAVLAK